MKAARQKTTVSAPDILSAATQWPAFLKLRFAGGEYGTRLLRSEHDGPLYVQKAFYPEGPDCSHVYLLHPPGGIVSGDTLDIELDLVECAQVLVTTPGASRLYRARCDHADVAPLAQRVMNNLYVAENSFLEWLPGETIVYDGAHIELSTSIHLDQSSSVCAWEVTCMGLPASDAPFVSGRFMQRFSLYVDDKPQWLDRLAFTANAPWRNAACGLQQQSTFGTLVAGPHFSELHSDIATQLRSMLAEATESSALYHCAVTVYNDFLLVRYLGPCAEQARKLFTDCWSLLRPLINDKVAVKPGIWAT